MDCRKSEYQRDNLEAGNQGRRAQRNSRVRDLAGRVNAYTRTNNAPPLELEPPTLARHLFSPAHAFNASMKVNIKKWHAIAQWRWDTGNNDPEDDGEGDVCGICRVPFEGCCPTCKMPGDDCPLSACILYSYPSMARLAEWSIGSSMGRVYSCLSHALLATMDWYCIIKTTVPDGQEAVG